MFKKTGLQDNYGLAKFVRSNTKNTLNDSDTKFSKLHLQLSSQQPLVSVCS